MQSVDKQQHLLSASSIWLDGEDTKLLDELLEDWLRVVSRGVIRCEEQSILTSALIIPKGWFSSKRAA